MGTTLIIVELLIIGFQVLIWVGLLLSHFDGLPIRPEELSERDPLLVGFLVGAAYTLGIVWDRVLGHTSTWLLQPVVRGVRRTKRRPVPALRKWLYDRVRHFRDKSDDQEETDKIDDFYRNHIFRPHAYEASENANRQVRLLRATGFNSVIIGGMLFAWHRSEYKALWITLAILGGLCFLAWMLSTITRKRNRADLYHAAQREESAKTRVSLGAGPKEDASESRVTSPATPTSTSSQSGSSPMSEPANAVQPHLRPPDEQQKEDGENS